MKIFQGKIISKKMQKTSTVVVERLVAHPVYKKRVKILKKYQVHDETDSKVGDVVRFTPCTPVSKSKRWVVISEESTKVVKKETKKK